MRILVVGSFRWEMYAPAFSYGFRQLGHEVTEIDYEQYHLKGKFPIFTFHNRFQDRFHYGLMMGKYNSDIVKAVEQKKPDIVFLYRCYHVYNSTLKAIKGKTFLISYNNDDPFSNAPSRKYYRYHIANSLFCDINYVYRKKNIIDYSKLGIYNAYILLPYYMSRQNRPLSCKKDIPVAFIGHYENDGRDITIKKMKEAGIPVRVYGKNYRWGESKVYNEIKDVLFDGIRGDEYNLMLNRTMIALVFLSKQNSDTYTRRCFEIPAAKTMMIAPYTDDLNELFPEDSCAIYYRSNAELIEKCKYYLTNQSALDEIALNGFERLKIIGGSETDRCKEVIKRYLNQKKV